MRNLPPPQPLADPDSQEFWDHTAKGELAFQHCDECGEYQFPPLEVCRHCGGSFTWEPLSGKGIIHSFIIQHYGVTPGYDGEMPYVIAQIALDEAPHLHLPSRIVGVKPDEVKMGAPVTVEIVDLPGGDFKIPVFKLAS